MAPPGQLIAGLAVVGIALILHIVAVATPHWASSGSADVGLFKICIQDTCFTYDSDKVNIKKSSSLKATQAMVILGLLATVTGLVLGALVYVVQYMKQNSGIKFHVFAMIALLVAGVLVVIGAIIFRTKVWDDMFNNAIGTLDYSYFLAIVGSVFGWAGGSLILRGGKTLQS